MLDFLALFFHAVRYSLTALAHPARDPGLRRLQYATLVFCVAGICLLVAAIVCLFQFNGAGLWWLWLLLACGVSWCIAACTGNILDRYMQQYQPGDDVQ